MTYQSVFATGLFAGRSIVVTGGGSGIGRCAAHELAHLGAEVTIIGRSADKLEVVAREIAEDGGSANSLVCDIRDEEAVSNTVAIVLERTGRIDGLVNNAGGQFMSPLEQVSNKGFNAVISNNLTGGFTIMREAVNQWMKAHGGAIVNITADFFLGWPGCGHSGAARAGMHNLTETAAVEWARYGVRVNSLAPGLVASSGLDTYPEAERQRIREQVVNAIPLRRWGTESEVAAGIVYLPSPAASFVTGTCLRIDGGTPNARQAWPMSGRSNVAPFNGFHRSVLPSMLSTET